MFSLRILGGALLGTMGFLSHGAHAEGDPGRCISRQHQPTGISLGREPAAVHGLEPLVSLPSEGHLTLGCCSDQPSPVGDLTFIAGPFDPESQRLYLWGFDRNGWVEAVQTADTWVFGESGVIEPRLYHPADDIEDVTQIERSEVLGVQFYSGYTAPHWLTGSQSYRVYQISGSEMTRVPELEAGRLAYLGDDLDTGFAVFAPAGASWVSNPDVLVRYDGAMIATPPTHPPPPARWCQ